MKNSDLNSERHLILKMISGDTKAFEIIFNTYKNQIFAFVKKMSPPSVDPNEIVQKVFVKVWINREKIDHSKSLSSLLFTIAKNEVLDQIKSALCRKLYFTDEGFIRDLNLYSYDQQIIETNELESILQKILNKLPERRRQIFNLSRFEGLTYKQIGLKLGISENTVDTQIRLSLNFLRTEFIKFLMFISFFFRFF